jgi:hypothetical protein
MNTIQQGQQMLALKKNRQDRENKKRADTKVRKYSDEIKKLISLFPTDYDRWSIIVILYEYLIQECNKHITPKEEKCRSREEFDRDLEVIENQLGLESVSEDEKYENLVMLVLYFYFNIELFGKFMRKADSATTSRAMRGLNKSQIEKRKKEILEDFFKFKKTKIVYSNLKDDRLDELIKGYLALTFEHEDTFIGSPGASEVVKELLHVTLEAAKDNNIDELLHGNKDIQTAYNEARRLDIVFNDIKPKFKNILVQPNEDENDQPNDEDEIGTPLNLGKITLPIKTSDRELDKWINLDETDLQNFESKIEKRIEVYDEEDLEEIVFDHLTSKIKKFVELRKDAEKSYINLISYLNQLELEEEVKAHVEESDKELEEILKSSREASKMASEINEKSDFENWYFDEEKRLQKKFKEQSETHSKIKNLIKQHDELQKNIEEKSIDGTQKFLKPSVETEKNINQEKPKILGDLDYANVDVYDAFDHFSNMPESVVKMGGTKKRARRSKRTRKYKPRKTRKYFRKNSHLRKLR